MDHKRPQAGKFWSCRGRCKRCIIPFSLLLYVIAFPIIKSQDWTQAANTPTSQNWRASGSLEQNSRIQVWFYVECFLINGDHEFPPRHLDHCKYLCLISLFGQSVMLKEPRIINLTFMWLFKSLVLCLCLRSYFQLVISEKSALSLGLSGENIDQPWKHSIMDPGRTTPSAHPSMALLRWLCTLPLQSFHSSIIYVCHLKQALTFVCSDRIATAVLLRY